MAPSDRGFETKRPASLDWLLAGLSQFEGNPAAQAVFMGLIFFASGTAMHCLKAMASGKNVSAESPIGRLGLS